MSTVSLASLQHCRNIDSDAWCKRVLITIRSNIVAKQETIDRVEFDEKAFRWALNEDEMATDKLADGVRKFAADAIKLENIIRAKLK